MKKILYQSKFECLLSVKETKTKKKEVQQL